MQRVMEAIIVILFFAGYAMFRFSHGAFWILAVAAVPAFFIGFFYIYAPLMVPRKETRALKSDFRLVSADDPQITADARRYIERTTAELIESGFEFLTYLKDMAAQEGSAGYCALLANDPQGELAQIMFVSTTVRTEHRTVVRDCVGMVIETHYADGHILQSATLPAYDTFVERANVKSVSFEGFTADPAELLGLHRFLETQLGHGRATPSGASQDPIGFMNRQSSEVMQLQVEHGLYRVDEAAGLYRLTLKGAYRITWKLLPPWRQLIKARARREGRDWYQKGQAQLPLEGRQIASA